MMEKHDLVQKDWQLFRVQRIYGHMRLDLDHIRSVIDIDIAKSNVFDDIVKGFKLNNLLDTVDYYG